jgi:hypothetical protein
MDQQEQNELRHQMAFAERQFLIYQSRAALNIAIGHHSAAQRFIEMMEESNDFIDDIRRRLEP